MPTLYQGTRNLIRSFKLLLISSSVLSLAVMLKFTLPAITDFAVSEIPSIWNGLASWLRPPYLYLLINCIIISIVASSKLQSKLDNSSPSPPETTVVQVHPVLSIKTDFRIDSDATNGTDLRPTAADEYNHTPTEVSYLSARGPMDAEISSTFTVNASSGFPTDLNTDGEEVVISKSSWIPTSRDSSEYGSSAEKPPASARFAHRKNVKSMAEGGGKSALGVANSKAKRQDTLESTWKTITEGRPMPLTRHLRKSDTWETHGGSRRRPPPQHNMMTKSETFNDRSATAGSSLPSQSPGSGKLKKEPSLSQEELNRRVEAFISKFNEEMRLQRQESLKSIHGYDSSRGPLKLFQRSSLPLSFKQE